VSEKREKLMALDGVSGVSEKSGEITVYLSEDSEAVREQVKAIAGEVKVVVTGKFGA
jgi:hypothetical protein